MPRGVAAQVGGPGRIDGDRTLSGTGSIGHGEGFERTSEAARSREKDGD